MTTNLVRDPLAWNPNVGNLHLAYQRTWNSVHHNLWEGMKSSADKKIAMRKELKAQIEADRLRAYLARDRRCLLTDDGLSLQPRKDRRFRRRRKEA